MTDNFQTSSEDFDKGDQVIICVSTPTYTYGKFSIVVQMTRRSFYLVNTGSDSIQNNNFSFKIDPVDNSYLERYYNNKLRERMEVWDRKTPSKLESTKAIGSLAKYAALVSSWSASYCRKPEVGLACETMNAYLKSKYINKSFVLSDKWMSRYMNTYTGIETNKALYEKVKEAAKYMAVEGETTFIYQTNPVSSDTAHNSTSMDYDGAAFFVQSGFFPVTDEQQFFLSLGKYQAYISNIRLTRKDNKIYCKYVFNIVDLYDYDEGDFTGDLYKFVEYGLACPYKITGSMSITKVFNV